MPHNFDALPSRRIPQVLNKWTWYPKDTLPMWVADADFPVAPQIQQALHKQITPGALGYEVPSPPLRQVIAARMEKLYGWKVDPEWLMCCGGVNHGYNIAARILCSKWNGYLIQP